MERIKYSEMMRVYCKYCKCSKDQWFICKNPECREEHKAYVLGDDY